MKGRLAYLERLAMSHWAGESHRMTNEVEQDSTNEGQQSQTAAAEMRTETPRRTWSFAGWLWQGARARELRHELTQRSPRTEALILRARASLAAARNLKTEEGEEKGPDAIVAHLYLDAVRWSLEAMSEAVRPAELASLDTAPATEDALEARETEGAERTITSSSRTAINSEHLARLAQGDFQSAAQTYEKLQSLEAAALWEVDWDVRQLKELDQLAQAALDAVERPSRELDNIWFARLVRIIVPLVVLTAGALGGTAAVHRATVLAETQYPWKASSTYSAEKGCESPHQECAETRFFFCTDHQDNPWVEFDLGKSAPVSRIVVKNRTDCGGCAERAVPLVVEVSQDRETWKEVARQKDSFVDWKAQFPAEEARWVRLRSLKRTYLHLQQVRISH